MHCVCLFVWLVGCVFIFVFFSMKLFFGEFDLFIQLLIIEMFGIQSVFFSRSFCFVRIKLFWLFDDHDDDHRINDVNDDDDDDENLLFLFWLVGCLVGYVLVGEIFSFFFSLEWNKTKQNKTRKTLSEKYTCSILSLTYLKNLIWFFSMEKRIVSKCWKRRREKNWSLTHKWPESLWEFSFFFNFYFFGSLSIHLFLGTGSIDRQIDWFCLFVSIY